MAEEFNIPVECQRYWVWAKRQNHTFRPNRPMTEAEESLPVRGSSHNYLSVKKEHYANDKEIEYYNLELQVGSIKDNANKAYNADLKLFLEINRDKVV